MLADDWGSDGDLVHFYGRRYGAPMTPEQAIERRLIEAAKKLGVDHASIAAGLERQVIVMREALEKIANSGCFGHTDYSKENMVDIAFIALTGAATIR